ncbi:iron reductase [Spongiactinospora gelatinilytica]|uniref:Iron reductase n=1 Tax=Spongiactinospora gelatinilytica TaxID=2666298 RepID=A0A2W2HAX7_9ACTN|nr:(2Fe-2S)-binding protein [Spongiactinospora gelatinilytica]PZG46668.1 iron reductase [Spongiactinospora gelatinilytica]
MESLHAALAEVAGYGAFFALRVGGEDAAWHSVREDYARGFADLVAATAARHGTRELRVGASIAQLGHAARLWSPVLGTTLAHGVVPDLSRLDRADDGPALRLTTLACRPAGPPEQAAGLLYDVVVRGHLEPLAAGLRVKVAPGLLYGNAASALAEAARAVVAARPDLTDPATRLTTALLAYGGLAGKGAIIAPGLEFRRTTCCLYYRAPGGSKCGDCALLGEPAVRRPRRDAGRRRPPAGSAR